MKEKMLSVKLPKGAKYQRVIVTEGSDEIQIVYSTECTSKEGIAKRNKIPKPDALIGGGEVYQEYDVPYWYCKIKGGRDTFMHLYMEDLNKNDLLYDSEGRKRVFSTQSEYMFKKNCMEALIHKPEEGFRWIPAYEVSRVSKHNYGLQVARSDGTIVPATFNCQNWEQRLISYSPENESNMCSKTTYFLLLLRWLKDGIATIEELADDSKTLGNYIDNPRGSGFVERAGARRFGGLYGFVGNTVKIVKSANYISGNSYLYLGGSYKMKGSEHPASKVMYARNGREIAPVEYEAIGLMELKK